MSTHDDAKDPKDLAGSEVMKPDQKFQSFFDKLVGVGEKSVRERELLSPRASLSRMS